MREIKLTKGYVTIVDDDEYERFGSANWFVDINRRKDGSARNVYARRRVSCGNGKQRDEYLHRVITGCPSGMFVDHINGNSLDNRKINLRICTISENQRNRSKQPGSSKFKGVRAEKDCCKWSARINLPGKRIHLGVFTSETEAALAYDAAAIKYFGDFCRTNKKEGLL